MQASFDGWKTFYHLLWMLNETKSPVGMSQMSRFLFHGSHFKALDILLSPIPPSPDWRQNKKFSMLPMFSFMFSENQSRAFNKI